MAPSGIQKKYTRANAIIKKVVEGVKMTIPAAVIDETDYCAIASTYGIDEAHSFDTLLDKMNETARTLETFDPSTISDNLVIIKEITVAIAQKETALEVAISEVAKLREHLSCDEALRDEIYAFVQKVLDEIEKVDEDARESAEDQITEHSDIIKEGALQMIHAGIDYENAWQFYHNAMLAFVKSNWEGVSENLGDEE
tara:strand:- start:54 stop:647 length:594 start_codon:yes stop_codon:yes gene_type:complete